jgi:SAM-dependent methyltransferase
MNEDASRVRAHFEDEAQTFDAHYDAAPAGIVDRIVDRAFRTQRLTRRLQLVLEVCRGATTVLEVGSGSGRVAVAIARANPEARVTGIDFSAEMNRLARSWASHAGVAERCEFIDGDFLEHDFRRSVFDVVVAPGVFDYVSAPRAPLHRMCGLSSGRIGASFPARYRVLAPARWARLRSQGCPVHFYTHRGLKALTRELPARLQRIDPEGSWIAGWYWVVLDRT